MKALLKHLINITRQRDHAMLDSAVASALLEMADAAQVRVHELFHFRDDMFIRPKLWVRDGRVDMVQESTGLECGVPVRDYPALAWAINELKDYIQETTPAGERIIWLPVWLNDKVSICFELVDPGPCDNDMSMILEGILEIYRNYQSILDYSERDSLTGLLNRKTFDEKFLRLLSADQPADPLQNRQERRRFMLEKSNWLAVVDIDHFKRVNDQFGHLYGDEVLILIANLLRSSFRTQDRIFRFGGEEFVVLLRSSTLEEAHKIFERFRTNVAQHEFPQVGKVTVSIGFAKISQESPVVTLGHADQTLYYAKAHGRNQVCHYDELMSQGLLHSEVSNETVEFF